MTPTAIANVVVFRVIVPLFFLAIQFFLWRKAYRWARSIHPHRRWLRVLLSIPFLLISVGMIYATVYRPRMSGLSPVVLYTVMYPIYFWIGATILLAVYLGIVGSIKFLIRVIGKAVTLLLPSRVTTKASSMLRPSPRFDPIRRTVLRRGMYGVTATAFGATGYGLIVEKSDIQITRVPMPIAGLPAALEGFTIALVSDIHSSEYMLKDEMQKCVDMVNALSPDMIVVDGDFVNSRVDEVYPFAEVFSSLKAPFGVHGVLGNHDYYSGDPDRIARVVDDAGIKIMRNEKKIITRGDASFYLIGIDDLGRDNFGTVKIDESIGTVPLAIPKIAVCHRPYYFRDIANRGVDIVLCGHTHGGQIVLAKVGGLTVTPAALVSPYVWGTYHAGNSTMYVSRGIGTVGIPIRIGCPPEITLLRLTAKA